MSTQHYQELCVKEFPKYKGKEGVCRDLAAYHSTEYLQQNGVGRPNPKKMKKAVARKVTADYKAFEKNPAPFGTNGKLLPETFLGSQVKAGFLLALVSAVVINILAKKISEFIIRKWLS